MLSNMSSEFIEKIRKWVQIDNDMKRYNEQLKLLRQNNHAITNEICDYMEQNSLTEKTIEISNGALKYATKKEYTPLTYQYVEDCLTKVLNSSDDVNYIMKYLKDHRATKSVTYIRRNDAK